VGALSIPMMINTAIRATFGSKWAAALRRAQDAGKMLAWLLVQVGWGWGWGCGCGCGCGCRCGCGCGCGCGWRWGRGWALLLLLQRGPF